MPVVGVIVYIGLVAALGLVTSVACVMFDDYVKGRRRRGSRVS